VSIPLTRPGKNSLIVETPVMPAAGVFGFGEQYRDLVDLDKLGAVVTNPVTYAPWSPATGTRVVPLDAGVLVHTGLPNPGLSKVLTQYRATWERMTVPIIVHIVSTTVDEVRRCIHKLDEEDVVAGVELGLNDDISIGDAEAAVRAATDRADKPILVRLPFGATIELARAVADAGAGGLVVCAPPRGTARDSAGKLVAGRLYGPVIKPLVLRMVGQMTRRVDIPVIGAGGIHSPQDARDYLEAGAVAVQVDSVTWVDPKMLEIIARDLGGLVITQPTDALPDEWHPGMGETERRKRTVDETTQEDKQR
jgi:dihydroorotate dehydrogenase (NAD+) catalytic subunit